MKIKRDKIPIDIKPTYSLTRERDGLEKISNNVKWIEFTEDGRYSKDFDKIKVGRCLLMSPFNSMYTWLTTDVTEIIEESSNVIKFKTTNSTYTLTLNK